MNPPHAAHVSSDGTGRVADDAAADSAAGGQRLAWMFGWRYLRARRRARFVSFTALSAMGGLALGMTVLITVLSIMNGFGDALRERILGTVPHVTVLLEHDSRAVAPLLARLQGPLHGPDITGVAPFFETQAMLMHEGSVLGVGLFGIDPQTEADVSILPQHVVRGALKNLRAVPDGVVLGEPLAFHIGVEPGDRVNLLVPLPDGQGGVRPVVISLVLVGTFQMNAEVDYKLALLDWRAVQGLGLSTAGRYGVRARVADVLAARATADRLRPLLPRSAQVDDWGSRYGELFAAVSMEKAMMGILLGLVVAIASFNVVSTLVMLVDDKRSDIAVLRTLGASTSTVGRIFMTHGALIAGIGLVLGVLGGIALSHSVTHVVRAVEWVLGVSLLQGTYFTEVPSKVLVSDVLSVAALGLIVSLAAAIYPARRAAALDPVQGLHPD